jgi:hypothetical protein
MKSASMAVYFLTYTNQYSRSRNHSINPSYSYQVSTNGTTPLNGFAGLKRTTPAMLIGSSSNYHLEPTHKEGVVLHAAHCRLQPTSASAVHQRFSCRCFDSTGQPAWPLRVETGSLLGKICPAWVGGSLGSGVALPFMALRLKMPRNVNRGSFAGLGNKTNQEGFNNVYKLSRKRKKKMVLSPCRQVLPSKDPGIRY